MSISATLSILISTILSASIVLFLLPKLLLLSLRMRMLDSVDARKIHTTNASRLGGVSFLPAIFFSIAVCSATIRIHFDPSAELNSAFALEASTLVMLYFIGMYDDILGVKYKIKFVAQILSAILIIISGAHLQYFYFANSVAIFPLCFAIPLTILVIIFIINAINLIDGINGLASMLSIIALSIYGTIFYIVGDYHYALIGFSTVGALIPFWCYNVFGLRKGISARIFMGDCGSLVIGSILGFMAVRVWNLSGETNEFPTCNIYCTLAYSALFVPCVDVIRVMLGRLRNGKSMFKPDRSHIHHKFIALGYSPRITLLMIICIQIGFILINLLLSQVVNILFVLVIDLVIWSIMHILISRKIKKINN